MNLIDLCAASCDAAINAGKIVEGIFACADLEIKQKQIDDLVTAADIAAQNLIIGSLKTKFAKISIHGEEGDLQVDDKDTIKLKNSFENNGSIDSFCRSHAKYKEYSKLATEDIAVWVDPIDGTKEYTQGLKECVTVLIGIAFKERLIGGVIGRPLGKAKELYLGIVGIGLFKHSNGKYKNVSDIIGKKDSLTGEKRDFTPRLICTARSHFSDSIKLYMNACNPTSMVRSGGAGGKTLMVIEGVADAYVYPTLGTKKWDTCACEAVLLSIGGKLTTPQGNVYDLYLYVLICKKLL